MSHRSKHAGRSGTGRPPWEPLGAYVVLVAVMLAALLFRIQWLEVPLERDEGAYAHFAQLVLDGQVPYLDFYETKPPGLFYAYALLVGVFGDTLRGLHAAFLGVNLLSIAVLFLIGRKLLSPVGGAAAAAGFAVLSSIPRASGFTAQSEHLVALLVPAALLVLLRALDSGRLLHFASSGALAALACTIKQSAVPFLAFLLVVIGLAGTQTDRRGRRKLVRGGGVFGAAVVGIYLLTLLLMAVQGAFAEFWFWTHEYPLNYASQFDLAFGWERLVRLTGKVTDGYGAIWALAGVGLAASFVAPIGKTSRLTAWSFLGFSLLSLCPGLRFYGHYSLQMMPAVAILIGIAVESIRRLLSARLRWPPGRAVIGATLVLGLAVAVSLAQGRDYYFGPDPAEIVRSAYPNNPFPEAKVIGDYLRNNTKPDDRVLVFGSEPEVYFYSRRRGPSRHRYFEYTVTKHPRYEEWQEEFILDVERAMPRYLVYFNHRASFAGDTDRKALALLFDWFEAFAERHYRPVGLADCVEDRPAVFVWGPEVVDYRIEGSATIWILERRTPSPRSADS